METISLNLTQNTVHYNFIKTTNIPTTCLNSLKFISSFIIAFVLHYRHFPMEEGFPLSNLFKWSYNQGCLLVELFFMLSGFGMFIGYGKKIMMHKIEFKNYILKRITKLYPLFFFTTILVTILEIWHIKLTGKTFVYGNLDSWHFFMNLILCQNSIFGIEHSFNGPSWCLSICFILYIINYIVLYYSKEKYIYIYSILIFIGLSIISLNINYPFIINPFLCRGLSCFSIGVILANIYLNHDKLNTNLIGYISLLILTSYYFLYNTRYNTIIGNLRFVFILIISPLTIFSVLFVSWINKFFSTKPMIFLGSLSMNIYLLHFIIQNAIRNIDLHFRLGIKYSSKKIWLIYCCSTILVSFLYNKYLGKIINSTLNFLAKSFLKNK